MEDEGTVVVRGYRPTVPGIVRPENRENDFGLNKKLFFYPVMSVENDDCFTRKVDIKYYFICETKEFIYIFNVH